MQQPTIYEKYQMAIKYQFRIRFDNYAYSWCNILIKAQIFASLKVTRGAPFFDTMYQEASLFQEECLFQTLD